MNASVYRNTAFELVSLLQGANQFRIAAISRTAKPTVNSSGGLTPPASVTLEVHEDLFSEKEMAQVHAALELLENKFAEAYAKWLAEPERLNDAIRAAELAKVEKAQLDMEMVLRRAELASLDEELAAKRSAR